MELLLKSIEDTDKFALEVAKALKPGKVIALFGDLGSGKTTFTSYLTHHLGIEKRVQSPTFVIARTYESALDNEIKIVNHLDLYRLTTDEEIEDLGIDDLFAEPNSVTVIEWAEKGEKFLPDDAIKIKFEYIDEDERRVYVQNLH